MSPANRVRFHRCAKWVWVAMTVPTVLFWANSILWLAFMSLYAIWIGHDGALEAARAALEAEERANGDL